MSNKKTQKPSLLNQTVSFSFKTLLIVFVLFVALLVVTILNPLFTNTKQDNKDTETVQLVTDYASLLSEETISAYEEVLKDYLYTPRDLIDQDTFIGLGSNKPDITLETYEGKQINIAEIKGKVILEVIADWCGYCQKESAENLDELVAKYDDVTFVQYMLTGGKQQVEDFYAQAGVDMNENIIVVLENEALTDYLTQNNFKSFPTFLCFDENKCVGSILGAVENNYFDACMALLYSDKPLYEVKTVHNLMLGEEIRRINIAINYINELTEIDVPKELLNEK